MHVVRHTESLDTPCSDEVYFRTLDTHPDILIHVYCCIGTTSSIMLIKACLIDDELALFVIPNCMTIPYTVFRIIRQWIINKQ